MVHPLVTSFDKQRRRDFFIDKSDAISYLNAQMDKGLPFHCVAMPSRFGKTYIARMLAAYYAKQGEAQDAFKGLSLENDPSFERHLNKHNVIFLDIAGLCARCPRQDTIREVSTRIDEILSALFSDQDFPKGHPEKAIHFLNNKLGATFVFVIDEWDFLLRNYPKDATLFDEYITFLGTLFDNTDLLPAIDLVYMTGIMPIKRFEGVSGLPRFREYTMVDPGAYAPYFGFRKEHVNEAIKQSGTTLSFDELQQWYGGYYFANVGERYCPNSVIRACEDNKCRCYTADTMSNEAIMIGINNGFIHLTRECALLLRGKEVAIHNPDSFTSDYSCIDTPDKGLITLVHSGFLRLDKNKSTVRIPNKEMRLKFEDAIDDFKLGGLLR